MRYEIEWLLECLLIGVKSPATYEHLRVNKILPLPSEDTLRKMISSMSPEFGFNDFALQCIKRNLKKKSLPERYGQTCPLITKNRSIARSLIIPKKWSIARSLITEIEVINRSLNSITFRSKHLKYFSLFLYYCPDCPSKLECLHKTKWIAVNYLFDVFVGLSIQQRQHSPFNFEKTSISKLRSDNRVLFAVKIKPAVLKTRSHAADDGNALLYSLIRQNL